MAEHNEFSAAKKKSSDLSNDIPTFNAENLQSNMKIIYYSRTFLSIIGGVIAGILGFTGLTGFILYFLIMTITSAGLMEKSRFSTHSYFDSWNRVVLDGFFSGLMSFVLFWTYHLAGGRCIGGVTVQERSTRPWAGLIPLAFPLFWFNMLFGL